MKASPATQKKVLAVETSCDDTSVAVVREDGFVIFNEVVDQDPVHEPYGGVVPELAGRNHAQHLLPLIERAVSATPRGWEDIHCLAVTNRPGLIGSLIVGLVTVKSLSLLLKKPYVAINHIEGHILSPFLWDKINPRPDLEFPFLALIVSGGHTYLFEVKGFGQYFVKGCTRDDSAGEALDKVARLLGLSYPGGAQMDRLSRSIPLGRYSFPDIKLKEGEGFSFSGLKTAAVRLIESLNPAQNPECVPYLCADFQQAVVRQLMDRLDKTARAGGFKSVVLAGGVSANSLLRKTAGEWARGHNIKLVLAPLRYCTDNAAMIGLAGIKQFQKGVVSPQDLNCFPRSLPGDFCLPGGSSSRSVRMQKL